MALTPRAVVGGLVLFALFVTLPLFATRRKDPQSSQNGLGPASRCPDSKATPFFVQLDGTKKPPNGCQGEDDPNKPNPPATYPNRVVVLQDAAKSFTVTITPALWDSGQAQSKHTILQVVFSGQSGMTLQYLLIGTVLNAPGYLVLDTTEPNPIPSAFVTTSPLLLNPDGCEQDNSCIAEALEPTPIALADGSNTRWDFSQFASGAASPLNLVVNGFPSEFQNIDIFPNSNPLTPESFAASNFLVIVRDSLGNILPAGGLPIPAPAKVAKNDLSSAPTAIPSLPFSDTIDASATNPQEILLGNGAGGETTPQSDPGPFCSSDPSRVFRSVWYTFTSSGNNTVQISTNGSRYDTLVYVFTDAQPPLMLCNDDGNSQVQSSDLSFAAVAGTTYNIMVSEFPPDVGHILDQDNNPIPAARPLSNDATLTLNLSLAEPVPFIDSVQPSSALPRQTVPVLTLYGAGFVSGATVVKFNGVNLTPASISPNKIVLNNVVVPGNPVTVPILVVNPNESPNVGTSNIIPFPVTPPAALANFKNTATTLDGAVFAPVVADLDNDGKLDVVFASSPNSGVVVLLGNGDGTFQPASVYPALEDNNSVAVGDFNGDGILDLIVTNSSRGNISLLLGNGDGTFQIETDYQIGGSPFFAMTGDFNGDGKLDLALLEGSTETVWILLGNGDGTFQPRVPYPAGTNLMYAIPGDFNGDGNLDIAVLNNGQGVNSVSILLGNGNGTFQAPMPPAPTDVFPIYAVVGDFDGDGKLDLAVATQTNGTVSVLLGNKDGTFQPRTDYPAGGFPGSVVAGDMDGDGKLDLLVGTAAGLSLLVGNGDGTFQNAKPFSEPNQPSPAVLGDFNSDGRLDVIAADDFGYDVSLQQVPRASLSPSSLTFATQAVATTSPAQAVTLTNTGSAALNVSSILASGDFKETNTCTAPLKPGSKCMINVTLTPTNIGSLYGAITLLDNASISPQIISLSGTGSQALTLAPRAMTFGNVVVGKTSNPKTETITNVEATALNISFAASGNYSAVAGGNSPCGSSLAGGASCTLFVTFTPTANGAIDGAVTITDHTVIRQQLVELSGTGTGGGTAPLTFNPTTLSFTNQVFNTTSKAQGVTVTNTGAVSVTISSVTAGGNFSVTGSGTKPCNPGRVLAVNGSCTMNVTFTPTTSGTVTGGVVVSDNATVGQQVLNVSGAGVLPVSFSHTLFTFGAQDVGTTSTPQTVTVINNLSTTLNGLGISVSGDFAVGNNMCPTSLAALSTCTFDVTFTPGQVGSIKGSVTVADSAITNPQVIKLVGTGR